MENGPITKWTSHKEWSFVSKYFLLRILFQFKNPIIKSWFNVPTTQMSIFIIFVSAGVLFEVAFFQCVPLEKQIFQFSSLFNRYFQQKMASKLSIFHLLMKIPVAVFEVTNRHHDIFLFFKVVIR